MLCPVHYIKKSAKTPVFLIKKSAKKRGKYRYNSGPKKTLRVYLRTTCTSGKGLYGHQRSTCELYRNMVSTRVCANNFFSVVQLPEHYPKTLKPFLRVKACAKVYEIGYTNVGLYKPFLPVCWFLKTDRYFFFYSISTDVSKFKFKKSTGIH